MTAEKPDWKSAGLKVAVAVLTTMLVSLWTDWRETRKAKAELNAEYYDTLDNYREYIKAVMAGDECPPCNQRGDGYATSETPRRSDP